MDSGKALFNYCLGVTLSSPKSRFILLSLLEYDPDKISSLTSQQLSVINNSANGFALISSGVTFKNLRFEGKLEFIQLIQTA
jgi:hypothetical protein